MELALGTVQFGLPYGIAGGKSVLPDDDVRKVLELAFAEGMTILDTAPSYGDIECRLGKLCKDLEFRIVSKIPPLPDTLDDMRASQWAIESARTSQKRLGRKLYALLFHRAEDLFGARGDRVWSAVKDWATAENILLGVSGYDAVAMRSLFDTREISIAQLPGNALDQRIAAVLEDLSPKPELHLRSAFLQGLLLLPFEDAVRLVPSASVAMQQWHRWLSHNQLTALRGALSVVKSFKDVATCVVGVDSISQLAELTNAWREAKSFSARELDCEDRQSIDPRFWDTWE